ncbi:MAG: hypothetical protein H0T71_11995 [Acidobacteria bacterium]|nr:hypothetical protein [Acidobacteriota bacterium]
MRWVDFGIILSWFVMSRVLAATLAGVAPDAAVPEILWQLLPLDLLESRLGESLWYLHSQPPLFNAFVGALLQLPGDYTAIWRVLWVLLGVLFPLVIFASIRLVGSSRGLAHLLAAIVCLNPTLLLYENFLFYSYPEALCVLVGLYAFLNLGPGERGWKTFGVAGSLLTLFRATFQPLWALGIVLTTAWSLRQTLRTVGWIPLLAPLILGSALVVKNGVMFGVWSSSSWYGMNAAKLMATAMLGETEQLVALGVVSPLFAAGPFQPVHRYPATMTAAARETAVAEFHSVPALVVETKPNGQPNFNHLVYIEISKQLAADSMAAARARWLLFTDTLSRGFQGFLQPASFYMFVDANRKRVLRLDEAYRQVVYPGGSALLVQALLAASLFSSAAILVLNVTSRVASLRPAAGYVLVTVVWVTLTCNLAEYGENNRFRFTLDPMMVTWLAVVSMRLWRREPSTGRTTAR